MRQGISYFSLRGLGRKTFTFSALRGTGKRDGLSLKIPKAAGRGFLRVKVSLWRTRYCGKKNHDFLKSAANKKAGRRGSLSSRKMQPPAYLQLPRCQGNTLGSPQFNTRTGSGGKRRLYCHVFLSHSPSSPTAHAALVLYSSPAPRRPSSTPGLATPTQPSPQVSPLLTPAPLQAPSTPTPVLCPLPWARPTLNSRAKASPHQDRP